MNSVDQVTCGIVGTALSAVGAGMSVTDLQAIISIIVTITGFIISVLIPLIVKLVKKIKKAKEDGVITEEEMTDIIDTSKEVIDKTTNLIDEIKEKKEDGSDN